MLILNPEDFSKMIMVGYVDVGTGQVIASGLAPILAGLSAFFLGFFGFFFLRFKKLFKKIKEKLCPQKKSSSSVSTD